MATGNEEDNKKTAGFIWLAAFLRCILKHLKSVHLEGS